MKRQNFRTQFLDLVGRSPLSIDEIARLAGLGMGTLPKLTNGDSKGVQLSTVKRIAAVEGLLLETRLIIPVAYWDNAENDYVDLGEHQFRYGEPTENYHGRTARMYRERLEPKTSGAALAGRLKIPPADLSRYEKGRCGATTTRLELISGAVQVIPVYFVPVEELITPAYVERVMGAAKILMEVCVETPGVRVSSDSVGSALRYARDISGLREQVE